MSCSACGGKSRRPLRTGQGGQPVNQRAQGQGNAPQNNPNGGIRSRIAGLKWGNK